MSNVKNITSAVLILGLLCWASCKKTVTQVIDVPAAADSAFLSITNASPAISSLLLYIGNTRISLPDSPLDYGSTTYSSYITGTNTLVPVTHTIPYIRIPSGFQQINFTTPSSSHFLVSVSNYFAAGNYYSVFVTDSSSHGQLPYVLIQDFIRATDTSQAQIRFLNLSPDAPPMDIWAFPNAGVNGYKLFSNCAYLPTNDGQIQAADTFALIKPDPYYFVGAQAGTYNALISGGLIVRGQSISTIYSLGYLSSNGPFQITAFTIQFNP